jgi:hypothetical protein
MNHNSADDELLHEAQELQEDSSGEGGGRDEATVEALPFCAGRTLTVGGYGNPVVFHTGIIRD